MTVRAEIRPIPEPPREVVLTMDYETAVSLLGVVRLIGGDDAQTYRSDTDRIEKALADAGVVPDDSRFTGDLRGTKR